MCHNAPARHKIVIATCNNPLDVWISELGQALVSHTQHRVRYGTWNSTTIAGFCLLFHRKSMSIPLLVEYAKHSRPNNFEDPYLSPNILHDTFGICHIYHSCYTFDKASQCWYDQANLYSPLENPANSEECQT